jgi:HEAT repeat protein
MEALCHSCKSPLDPTRAPIARVRGMRVVTYCSLACADAGRGDDAGEVARPIAAAAPVVTIAAAPPAQTEVVAAAPLEATDSSSKLGEVADDIDEPAAAGELEEELVTTSSYARREVASGSRKWQIVAGSTVALICGMGIVAIEACPSSTDVRAAAERSEVVVAAKPELVAPPPPEAKSADDSAIADDELFERALASLRAFMQSPSPRLQRISAMALARNRDAAAIKRLGELMPNNTSDLVKVQIAYTLARAGNQEGRDVLVASLRARKRDARLDAARFLVQLGDQSAAKVLRNMLSYRHFRVGAAGLLARLGNPEGVAALRQVVKFKGSSRELRMRALVALGLSGDESAHDELVAILSGGQYQIGAALALAALGDKRAVPALERQLALDSFRVGAALGLRRLGEKVDLTPLAMALQTGNDVSRVTAAEAILILTGPAELAELD